jgi:hypothetical protein
MIKKFNKFSINEETSPDVDYEEKVKGTNAYRNLRDEIHALFENFQEELYDDMGYEEGDNDKDAAVQLAFQLAVNSAIEEL